MGGGERGRREGEGEERSDKGRVKVLEIRTREWGYRAGFMEKDMGKG